jgi:hypothetical protein
VSTAPAETALCAQRAKPLTTLRTVETFNNRFIVDSPLQELSRFMSLWGEMPYRSLRNAPENPVFQKGFLNTCMPHDSIAARLAKVIFPYPRHRAFTKGEIGAASLSALLGGFSVDWLEQS